MNDPIAFRAIDEEDFTKTRSAFVPQGFATEILTLSQPVLFFCFEVESQFYRAFMTRFNLEEDRVTHHLVFESLLISVAKNLACSVDYNRENAFSICSALVPEMKEPIDFQEIDRRIQKVVNEIDANLDTNHELESLAVIAHLSSSRLTHLFREQTGLSIRRYRVWKRIRSVLQAFIEGASMTNAAISVGFTDSSHFSNSCKKLLGLTPSEILNSEQRIELFFG